MSNDLCQAKLQEDWALYTQERDFRKLGKILRAQLNILKRTDSGIKEHEVELLAKVRFLEAALPEMDFKASIQVIGDISHARRSLKYSSADIGAAFKRKLSSRDRRRIRKRNPTPRFSASNGKHNSPHNPRGSNLDDVLSDDLGDDED